MPRKCKKCENEENYNFAINNGLCDSCIEQELEDSEIKNEQLEDLLKIEKATHSYSIKRIRELEGKNKKLREILESFLNCPRWVDEATVPKGGIEVSPKQVIFNMSISLVRIRNAEKILNESK